MVKECSIIKFDVQFSIHEADNYESCHYLLFQTSDFILLTFRPAFDSPETSPGLSAQADKLNRLTELSTFSDF